MDDAPVSPTLDGDVAVDDKRWPLVLVVTMFLAGVAPAFLPRSTPPPRPAASVTSCPPAPSTGPSMHT